MHLSGGWICPAGSTTLLHPVWLGIQQGQRPEGGWGVHHYYTYREQIYDKVDPTHQRRSLTGIVIIVRLEDKRTCCMCSMNVTGRCHVWCSQWYIFFFSVLFILSFFSISHGHNKGQPPQDNSYILIIQGPYVNGKQSAESVKGELVDNARHRWPLYFSKFYEVTMMSGQSTYSFLYTLHLTCEIFLYVNNMWNMYVVPHAHSPILLSIPAELQLPVPIWF